MSRSFSITPKDKPVFVICGLTAPDGKDQLIASREIAGTELGVETHGFGGAIMQLKALLHRPVFSRGATFSEAFEAIAINWSAAGSAAGAGAGEGPGEEVWVRILVPSAAQVKELNE